MKKTKSTTQQPLPDPNLTEEQLYIQELAKQVQTSQATINDLRKEMHRFQQQRKWFSKFPFIIILLSFILVGIACYVYPMVAGIHWIWHDAPDEVVDHFLQPDDVETPIMIKTLAIWVAYAVLWQIFVLVNVTDLIKYLHVYSMQKFRFLARVTMFVTIFGGIFMLVLCLRATNLIEPVLSTDYPIKLIFTPIIMVVPLVGALILSGGLPAHLGD